MGSASIRERLTDLRREFHQYPEPAWREFYTTSRIVDELETTGVNEIIIGRDLFNGAKRLSVPDEGELAEWHIQAEDAGARNDVLEATEGGFTGAIAVLEQGEGPTIALRVDIDALLRQESVDQTHIPAAEGFQSRNDGVMHACGHDAHMTIGLGVLEAIKDSDFTGTFKLLFQPAEEKGGGGRPMAESHHIGDIDYLIALHVGLGHPTGEVVAGIIKPLAVTNVRAEFSGESSHAGLSPNQGRNAMQAAAAAIQNTYAIPRHEDGMTRVNIGRIEGGTASNIIAEEVTIESEVRGETTPLMEYMYEEFERKLTTAAEMHGCTVELTVEGEAPRADSDEELVEIVDRAATRRDVDGVENIVKWAEFGASEDATHLMQAVQANDGLAAYSIIGTDHPTGHHTATFDVDEDSLQIGVSVLTESIQTISQCDPLGCTDSQAQDEGG